MSHFKLVPLFTFTLASRFKICMQFNMEKEQLLKSLFQLKGVVH